MYSATEGASLANTVIARRIQHVWSKSRNTELAMQPPQAGCISCPSRRGNDAKLRTNSSKPLEATHIWFIKKELTLQQQQQ